MGLESLSTFTKNVGQSLKRNSPAILTGLGVTGMVSTTILAVRATPRALELIEEEKHRQNYELTKEARDNGWDKCNQIDKLTPVDTVKTVWKCYIPAFSTGVLSILCLVGASTTSARRNAALATAYALSESTLREYKDKVVETIGEKKEKKVREEIAKDRIEQDPVSGTKEVFITEKGNTLCYDMLSGRYFRSDIDAIKKAVNELNHRMITSNYISLNEFYYSIGLSNTKLGNELGWRIEQGMIEVDFSATIADDGTPCLVLDYLDTPKYDFDRWL